jgi:hypothetical protein
VVVFASSPLLLLKEQTSIKVKKVKLSHYRPGKALGVPGS